MSLLNLDELSTALGDSRHGPARPGHSPDRSPRAATVRMHRDRGVGSGGSTTRGRLPHRTENRTSAHLGPARGPDRRSVVIRSVQACTGRARGGRPR